MYEATGIFGASINGYNNDQRRWKGESAIVLGKGKNRCMIFSGLDLGETVHDNEIVENGKKFKGSNALRSKRPGMNDKLYPLDKENRTFIG